MATTGPSPVIMWACCVKTYQTHKNKHINDFGSWMESTRISANLPGPPIPDDPIEQGATAYYSSTQRPDASRIGRDLLHGLRLTVISVSRLDTYYFMGESDAKDYRTRTWIQVGGRILTPGAPDFEFTCHCGLHHNLWFVSINPHEATSTVNSDGGSGSGSSGRKENEDDKVETDEAGHEEKESGNATDDTI